MRSSRPPTKKRHVTDFSIIYLHKTLEREDIAEASLLYRWKGKNPDLEPIALLSHQDVVPIEPGTEGDWTHEPFSG